MNAYWSWWQGALALAGTAAAYWLILRRPLGVSGHWERTIGGLCGLAGAAGVRDGLSFFAGLFLGGVAAALLKGGWHWTGQLGTLFTAVHGDGPAGWAVLFLGGILVGYGTRWADGCTSGHGLIGVSRFQPGSLAATAVFFASASATAFVLAGMIR